MGANVNDEMILKANTPVWRLLLKIRQLTDGIGHVKFLVGFLVSVSMCIGSGGNATLHSGRRH